MTTIFVDTETQTSDEVGTDVDIITDAEAAESREAEAQKTARSVCNILQVSLSRARCDRIISCGYALFWIVCFLLLELSHYLRSTDWDVLDAVSLQ